MANLSSNKEGLRIQLKEIRDSLSDSRRKQASHDACRQLYDQIGKAGLVLSFASFGSEINLWDLNNILMNEKRLALPKLVGSRLRLYAVQNKNDLEKSAWGIYEPNAKSQIVAIEQIDIGLISGLGFDMQTKHRLGYGKGFYDQLLSNKERGIEKLLGIGFLEQSVDELPYTSLDIPMHEIYLF